MSHRDGGHEPGASDDLPIRAVSKDLASLSPPPSSVIYVLPRRTMNSFQESLNLARSAKAPCPIGPFRRSHNSLFHVKCQLKSIPQTGSKTSNSVLRGTRH
jgi:hypothetical protein